MANEVHLSDDQLSPPRNKSPNIFSQTKLFPLGFMPALRNNNKQFGRPLWHASATNLDKMPETKNVTTKGFANRDQTNEYNTKTKKATYSEEKTTYVSRVSVKDHQSSKTKFLMVPKTLKDSAIDDYEDANFFREIKTSSSDYVSVKQEEHEADDSDSTDSLGNIVQKRIAMFEQKVK
ncbi:hypothetical protein HELRODRAFT_158798 [Helobdella robusta]|uniref:Uncharacterized protein n=1 Tax=Helobdella robusta TaxID=6412 RepID=T1ENA1_HELRO|nr:hypothetical protein HELRODRAFT_158798 [Helobdella robusta]ESO12310.1 hypothetical protein HELRODRAFT_158798 [Helobdella robusta]